MEINIDDLNNNYYINSEGNLEIIKKELEKDDKSLRKICDNKKLYQRVKQWLSRNGEADLSINDYRKLCKKLNIKFNKLNIEYIKNKSSRKVLPIEFPLETNYYTGRILGHLAGDGSLFKGGTSKFRPNYSNTRKHLIKSFKECVFKIFGKAEYYIEQPTEKKSAYTIIFPTVLGYLINDITGEDFRTKTQRIPFKYLDSKEAKKGFLQSIFSDDGTINPTAKQIDIRLANKELLEDLKKLLSEFDIKTSNIKKITGRRWNSELTYFRLQISGRFLRRFGNKINFVSDSKKERMMNETLDSYEVERSNVMGETRGKILKMLSKPMSTSEIKNKLDVSRNYTRIRLWRLKNEGLIKKVRKRKAKRNKNNEFTGAKDAKWGLKNV